jgi:hypothetical protein
MENHFLAKKFRSFLEGGRRMKKTLETKMIFKTLVGLLALAGTARAELLKPFYAEYAVNGSLDGKEIGQSLYLSRTLKVNERYSLTPEVSTTFTHREKGVNKFSVTHDYFRILLLDKVVPVGDWKLGVTYRYRAPTTTALQQAGSFGGFMVRPQAASQWNDLSWTLRLPIEAYLQRRPYQMYSVGGKAVEPNTALSIGFEILPTYKITDELSFMPSFELTTAMEVGTPRTWTNKFGYNWELAYSGPTTFNTSVGLFVDYGSEFGNGKGAAFKVASKDMLVGLILKRDLY